MPPRLHSMCGRAGLKGEGDKRSLEIRQTRTALVASWLSPWLSSASGPAASRHSMGAGGSAGKKAPPSPGYPEAADQKPIASAPSSASTGNPVAAVPAAPKPPPAPKAADGEAGASQAENVLKTWFEL